MMKKNPKHEIRNPKQIPMTQSQNSKRIVIERLDIWIWSLFRISPKG
jgi:hypothetical protein